MSWPRGFGTFFLASTLALVVLAVPGVATATGHTSAPAALPSIGAGPLDRPTAPTPGVASHADRPTSSFIHPPGLPLAGGLRPLAGGFWYTQIGATIGEINGSSSVSGLHAISVQFRLVTSPYPIAYELNGLSDSGDWYQIIVSDNWPGCNAGFEEGMETWDAFQGAGPVICDPTVTLSVGDLVQLGLNFTATGNACLTFADLTTAQRHNVCEAQPDAGGTQFIPVYGTAANGNGYYTGPMTEIINETASDCPDYTVMPRLDYDYYGGVYVTQYSPWSDEFDLLTGTLCYNGQLGQEPLGVGDPSTHFDDTAAGTLYGPHVVAAQNYSVVNSAYGWRVLTDPIVVTETESLDRPYVNINWPSHLAVTPSGGTPPYTGLWYVNSTLQPDTTLNFTFTSGTLGSFTVNGYAVDQNLEVAGPKTPVIVQVVGPLTLGTVFATPSALGADAGQTATFHVPYSGGIPPLAYLWNGLPGGCSTANVSSLTCTPQAVGSFNITTTVTDANGTTKTSGGLTFTVVSEPFASLASTAAELDVGQTLSITATIAGGAPPLTYSWNGLPSGCHANDTTSAVTCVPTTAGTFGVLIGVTDANGAFADSQTLTLLVHAAPTVKMASSLTTAETGDPLTVTATPLGGTGVYSLTWSGLPSGCVGGNVSSVQCTVATAGTYAIAASAVDTIGGVANGTPITLTVVSRLSVELAVSPTTTASGGLAHFGTTVAGGQGPYRYTWDGLPPSCVAPTNGTFDCELFDAGTFNVTVHVYDGLGRSASSSQIIVVQGSGAGGDTALGGTTGLLVGIAVIVAVAAIAIALILRRRNAPPPDDRPVEDTTDPPADQA